MIDCKDYYRSDKCPDEDEENCSNCVYGHRSLSECTLEDRYGG